MPPKVDVGCTIETVRSPDWSASCSVKFRRSRRNCWKKLSLVSRFVRSQRRKHAGSTSAGAFMTSDTNAGKFPAWDKVTSHNMSLDKGTPLCASSKVISGCLSLAQLALLFRSRLWRSRLGLLMLRISRPQPLYYISWAHGNMFERFTSLHRNYTLRNQCEVAHHGCVLHLCNIDYMVKEQRIKDGIQKRPNTPKTTANLQLKVLLKNFTEQKKKKI